MQKHMLERETILIVALGLGVLTGWLSSAEAVIIIKIADVQNGVAVVQGSKAAANAPIWWEDALVTQANKGGNFAFQGPVPADCVGSLAEGNPPGAAIDVALAHCPPVSSAPAPVPPTGQTQCWDAAGMEIPCAGTGQDGAIQAGVPVPSPRFTDQGNGTVLDNLTGLIWLKQADCFPGDGNGLTWTGALQAANALASPSCGLSDGSVEGNWRLPNRNEFQSLLDLGFAVPPISNAAGTGKWAEDNAFLGVQMSSYWTSTTIPTTISSPENAARAWNVHLADGQTTGTPKGSISGHVWPVRGPE